MALTTASTAEVQNAAATAEVQNAAATKDERGAECCSHQRRGAAGPGWHLLFLDAFDSQCCQNGACWIDTACFGLLYSMTSTQHGLQHGMARLASNRRL